MGLELRRQVSRLNALAVQRIARPGLYGDGDNLYLQVRENGSKSWIFRFRLHGRSRSMGLGSARVVTLAQAREEALSCRRLLLKQIDPINERRARYAELASKSARVMTFDEAAAAYIAKFRSEWKNGKHASQWENTLRVYVSPTIGKMNVQDIDTKAIKRILDPIWETKTETASRVRNRIELVLGWASANGFRSGDNPARWRGHLDKLLPKPSKIAKVENHAALPYTKISKFIADLRRRGGVGALGLELQILTAVRPGEVFGAKWSEIDFGAKIWTIPAERMKAGREHRVPLAPRALEILCKMRETARGEFVFPGRSSFEPLCSNAFLALLRRMSYVDERGARLTSHGFRSTFRDWASERTNFPSEVIEMALAHAIKDKTEAAYRRGDLLQKRTELMAEWATACAGGL